MVTVITTIAQLLYLFLPAAVANMMPVIVGRAKLFSYLAIPLDGGCCSKNKPLLGSHKTWRGLLTGIIAAVLVTGLQAMMELKGLNLVDYNAVWLPLGLLLGTGALIGDAVKSFFKRRCNVKEGNAWVPFDQIDFGIGAVIFLSPIFWLGWPLSFLSVVLLGLGHVLIVWIGYALGWRKHKW